MKRNIKLYFLFFFCVLLILLVWLYTLKLNLTKPEKNNNEGLSKIFNSLKNVGDSFKNLPPLPQNTTTPQDIILAEVSDKLLELTATSTPTSTADWQTYSNEKNGYEIKYPTSKIIITSDILERGTVSNPGFLINDGGHFAIGIYPNTKNYPSATKWMISEQEPFSGKFNYQIENNITRATSLTNKDCYIEWQIILKDNSFYTLAGEFCGLSNNQQNIDLYHNVTATFKFLK
ncbi:MAG TPA: hypothetical protein PLH37_02550 [bacterium]|nr:hypothetical protein [bacterium]